MKRCPGSSAFAQPKPEALCCPDCGTELEIWSDEALGRCPKCGKSVIRSESQSCVDWCKHAKECLGEEKFRQYGRMKAEMRKPALLAAAESACEAADMAAARRTMAYAEAILAGEPAADPHVVLAAALLRRLAQRSGGTAGAEEILIRLGYSVPCLREVCALVAPGAAAPESLDARVVQDAVRLADAEQDPAVTVDESFCEALLTPGGRRIAREMLKLGRASPGGA